MKLVKITKIFELLAYTSHKWPVKAPVDTSYLCRDLNNTAKQNCCSMTFSAGLKAKRVKIVPHNWYFTSIFKESDISQSFDCMPAGSQTSPVPAFTARNTNFLINCNYCTTMLDCSWAVYVVDPTALGVYAEVSIENLKLSTK